MVGIGQALSKLTNPDYVRLEGVDHLAMVLVLHYVPDDCQFYSHPHVVYQTLVTARSPAEGIHDVNVRSNPGGPADPFRCTQLKKEISITTSGSDWAYKADLSGDVLTLPDVVSNVTNGVGFLGGILTKRILFENCTIVGAALMDVCELTYDADSATIEGIVTDVLCRDQPPVLGGLMEVREMGGNRIRSATTDRVISSSSPPGYYQIGALEPGVEYSLSAGTTNDLYFPYETRFTLQSGERRALNIPLERRGNPSECS